MRRNMCVWVHECMRIWKENTDRKKGKKGTAKRKEVVDVFREGKLGLLALTDTKLKEKGEVS